jgi:hypothetical protein
MYASFETKKPKLSSLQHSGRLRPHEHTSYLPLAFMVLVVGVVLAGFSILSASYASAAHPDPQDGSIGLTGTVPATPPKVAATITSPRSGQHISVSPVTISGTCPAGTLVEIYKNSIFAGSTPCGDSGKYSIDVDLLYGQNTITAQVYDSLNQGGPPSDPIILFNDTVPPQSAALDGLNFSGTQLILSTNAVYRGTFPGQTLDVPVTIIGGTAPYAVNVVWGDSNNKIIPRSDNSVFNASHIYDKPGTYKITLAGTDSKQQVAFLTVAAIVNGQPAGTVAGVNSSGGKKTLMNKLLVLWPLYAVTATMVASFWMGEHREKKILDGGAGTTPPPLGNLSH